MSERTGSSAGRDRRSAKGRQRHRGASGPKRHSRSAPSQRARQADPARLTAFRVLRAVSRDDAYANLVLPAEIRRARLDRRDAAFATELTYGAIRGQGTYDAVIAFCIDRRLKDLDFPVLDALRLGAHQLLAMRVEDHAAVSETVALVRAEIGAGPSGFVNAVLRRIGEHDWDGWVDRLLAESPVDAASADHALALRHAHPRWVVRAMRQALRQSGRLGPADSTDAAGGSGGSGAEEELTALLDADNASPEVHLVALPGHGEAHLHDAEQAGAVRSGLLEGAARFRGGDVGRLPGIRAGELRVQDIGSQWIARALAGALTPESVDPDVAGERWLDLCAGPGGKAALLAALAAQHEAHLTANEPAEHRAELVRTALSPVEESAYRIRVGDGRTVAEAVAGEDLFDRILVDAPCTGLGALRRRPESRWRRSPKDLGELVALQEELLDAAVDVLAPGGLLAYVTCSPHPAETVVQVEDMRRRHPELRLLDAHEAMAAVAEPDGAQLMSTDPSAGPTVQLWPHVHGTDAMFFALFHRPT
ncbi:MAG: RsmB/NOP family class I SAM-dependent RNA methyltransferase, partial [Nesterenkonia sp.]|nr:RsmB/NOP family class I SAM-dependent RNA methyltransferase [Nesterenkonia sp.]